LPHDYVPGERLRLEAYRKIASAETAEGLAAVRDELVDRYGEPPQPVDNLLAVAEFRAHARLYGLTDVAMQGKYVRFVPLELLAAALLVAGCGKQSTSPGAAAIVGDQRISTQTLQDTVNRALQDPQAQAKLGNDRAGFTRNELGRLINDQVVAAAATAHGITVTEREIDSQIGTFAQQAGGLTQLYQSAAQIGVPRPDLRTF